MPRSFLAQRNDQKNRKRKNDEIDDGCSLSYENVRGGASEMAWIAHSDKEMKENRQGCALVYEHGNPSAVTNVSE